MRVEGVCQNPLATQSILSVSPKIGAEASSVTAPFHERDEGCSSERKEGPHGSARSHGEASHKVPKKDAVLESLLKLDSEAERLDGGLRLLLASLELLEEEATRATESGGGCAGLARQLCAALSPPMGKAQKRKSYSKIELASLRDDDDGEAL